MISVIVKPTKKVVVVNSYCNSADSVGVIGENNATTIEFSFPDYIEGVPISEFEKEFVWKHARDSGRTTIINNKLKLNSNHTQCATLTFQVRLLHNDIEWKTIPKTFKLADTLALPDVDKPTAEEWQEFKAEVIAMINSRSAEDLPETATTEDILSAFSNSFVELIQAFNEKFNLNIDNEAEVSDMLSALNNVEDATAVKEAFINAYNPATALVDAKMLSNDTPLTKLNADMTNEQVAEAINSAFVFMARIIGYYASAIFQIEEIYHDIYMQSTIWLTIDTDQRNNLGAIRQFIQDLNAQYFNIKQSLLGFFDDDDDGGFTFDSADEIIIEGLDNMVNSMKDTSEFVNNNLGNIYQDIEEALEED